MSSGPETMGAEACEALLADTLAEYRKVIPYRDDRLFTEFLPRGYRMTTLSCVPDQHLNRTLFIKCNLGMFITLLDDFADKPELRNKELLEKLYRVPFDDEFIDLGRCSDTERRICDLALKLRGNMKAHIRQLPGFLPYYDVFKFDFEQVMRANQYSELITDYPGIVNPAECSAYGAYNMGMVLAGMIDLMSCTELGDPLGRLRQAFVTGQRYARLSNVINTLERERAEDDSTNEIVGLAGYRRTSIAAERERAEGEMADLLDGLRQIEIRGFDLAGYIRGLESLHELHVAMRGTI